MAGCILHWDRDRISREHWTRFAIQPPDRWSGRAMVEDIRQWFAQHGRGRAMIFDEVFCCDLAVAFSDSIDAVLFRLSFTGMPIGFVPQPHAHQGWRIS